MSRTYRCVESKKSCHPKLLNHLRQQLNKEDNIFHLFHRCLRSRKPWRNIGDTQEYNDYKKISKTKNRAKQRSMLTKILYMNPDDWDNAVFDSFRVHKFLFDPSW